MISNDIMRLYVLARLRNFSMPIQTFAFSDYFMAEKLSAPFAMTKRQKFLGKMDRVGFEPTTSAMPMPYPTRLDDRP
jgi:hypothetical protein